jgi:sugar lactone lactonase YvrE
MTEGAATAIERLVIGQTEALCGVAEDAEGSLHVISQTGDVYVVEDNHLRLWFSTSGQPAALAFDSNGGALVADLAHQAIMSPAESEQRIEVTPLLKEVDGRSLLGPSSLHMSHDGTTLLFTDSGPMGETSLGDPRGSLYSLDLGTMETRVLLGNCLAHPSAVTATAEGDVIYVAETMRNRILRLARRQKNAYQTSVFYQFAGRLGPTALAISSSGSIVVGRYDFSGSAAEGVIAFLSPEGELQREVVIPDGPEITGLCYSKFLPQTLFVTEASASACYKLTLAD